MRALRPFAVAAALVLAAGAAFAADADRYVAPGGVFSIALTDSAAPLFRRGRESVSGDMTLADFPFVNSAGLDTASSRTVEWIKLDKPIDPTQFDGQATALVEGYLEGRYGAGKFAITGSGKFRSSDGRLVYAFSASTSLDQAPARWQGSVQFFDGGVALVSEIVPQPAGPPADPKGGIVSQPAVDWALTLKPGG